MMKKCICLLLSILMLLSTFTVLTFTSAAATLDESKIYVKVDNKHYEVKKGDVITYEYRLDYTEDKISSLDVRVIYDSSGVKFVPDVDDYGDYDLVTMFPVIKRSVVYNFSKQNEVLFNYSNMTGLRFMGDKNLVFSGKFEVITDVAGVYEINGYFETLADTKLNKIVFQHVNLKEYDEEKTIKDLVAVEDITEPETGDTSDLTEPQTTPPSEDSTATCPSEPIPVDPSDPTDSEPTETTPPVTEPTDVPTEPTEAETEPIDVPTEPTEAKTEPTGVPTETTEPKTEPTEPSEVQTDPTTDIETVPTDPVIIAEEGFYLVGTLNGDDYWYVDGNSADRLFKENEGVPGEYILEWTFNTNDEIKVVYFDGYEIKSWYKAGVNNNYKISADKIGKCTVYFRPDGNADWSYTYLYVDKVIQPTEPTDSTVPETEPTDAPTKPTEENTEPTDAATVPTEPETKPTEPQRALGDVNGDGKVDILDATAIQRHEALFERLTEEQLSVADTNKDGVISILDATMIQRLVALFIPKL